MTRARDVANVLSTATSLATDTETAAAISSHNTAGNGHIGRGTTANRPASPAVGDLYFDTTLDELIQYKSTGWKKMTEAPNPPTNVVATLSGNTKVSVSFTAPTNVSVSSYSVTSSPGNITVTGTSSPILVSGLNENTAYTFRVVAQGANGISDSSTASNSVTTNFIPIITGGTLTSDSTYYYRTFTNSGTFSVTNRSITAQVLLIGGGGGGSGGINNVNFGSGGASGVQRFYSNQTFSATNHTVTIGSGGTGAPSTASNGTATSFGNLTASAGNGSNNGRTGASNADFSGGTGSSGFDAGGGAGAGGNGGVGTPGNGGAGSNTYSSWLSVVGAGVSGFIGGGGASNTSTGAASGGGGAWGAGNGTVNTGSGAAGGGSGGGGNGGSGLAIIRYLKTEADA